MECWQNGSQNDWQNGGMAGWRDGGMAGWQNGNGGWNSAEWQNSRMAELVDQLILTERQNGRMNGYIPNLPDIFMVHDDDDNNDDNNDTGTL